jgi:hypothetical protein
MNKPEFRTTRYSIISRRDENNKICSYCSMGTQKFYVEDIDNLDKIKQGYLNVIRLHEEALKDKSIKSLETKLEVEFKK